MTQQELIEKARAAQPRFDVDSEGFAQFLTSRSEGAAVQTHLDDLYLAYACAQRDRQALRTFEQRYLSHVGEWIARLRTQDSFVDEVRQRLRERVLLGSGEGKRGPRILDYSGRGPLGGWTRVTAMREALDLIEKEKGQKPADLDVEREGDLLGDAIDPELLAIRQRHLPQFREAFRGALHSLDASERNLLRFHFVDGLNIARIGEIFGKSRATVGRMVIACRKKLLEETQRRLGDLSGASASDVMSLIRLLQSQLDVSIRGFLRRDSREEATPE